jgi:hypothetical protein
LLDPFGLFLAFALTDRDKYGWIKPDRIGALSIASILLAAIQCGKDAIVDLLREYEGNDY